eukprot:9254897-Ditylum_brightwellii.AAC.1
MDRDDISSLDTWCSVNNMTLCEMIMNQRTHDDNCLFIAVGQSTMRDGSVSFISPKNYADQAMQRVRGTGQYMTREFGATVEDFFTLEERRVISNSTWDPVTNE